MLAVGGVGDGEHAAVIEGERDRRARAQQPQPDGGVAGPRQAPEPLGGERHGVHAPRVPRQHRHGAGRNVPQPQRVVRRPREQRPAVGRELHGVDRRRVAPEHRQCPRAEVEDRHEAVVARRREPPAVRRERHGVARLAPRPDVRVPGAVAPRRLGPVDVGEGRVVHAQRHDGVREAAREGGAVRGPSPQRERGRGALCARDADVGAAHEARAAVHGDARAPPDQSDAVRDVGAHRRGGPGVGHAVEARVGQGPARVQRGRGVPRAVLQRELQAAVVDQQRERGQLTEDERGAGGVQREQRQVGLEDEVCRASVQYVGAGGHGLRANGGVIITEMMVCAL